MNGTPLTPPQPPPYPSPSRRLISESIAYAIVEAGQNVLALLVVPASLFWLTPTDMGAATLAQLATQFTLTVAMLGLDFAIVRSYLKWPEDARIGRVRRMVLTVAATSGLLALGAAAVWIARPHAAWAAIGFLAVVAGGGLAVRALPMAMFRVTSRFRPYAAIAIGGSILQALLQITLLVAGKGLLGYLAAVSVASCAGAAAAWIAVPRAAGGSPLGAPDRALVKVAASGFLSAISDRLVNNADRFALSAWTSLDALGVYGTASRMSIPLRMVSGATNLALAPALSREEGRGRMADVSATIVAPFVTLLALLGALLQLFSWSFWLTPWRHVLGDFQPLLSVLVLSQLLASVVVVGQLLLYYMDRPIQAGALAATNAVMTIAGLAWLVPRYGANGAALVQLLASMSALGAIIAVTHTLRWVGPRVVPVLVVSAVVTAAVWIATPAVSAVVTITGTAILTRWAWRDLDHGRVIRDIVAMIPSALPLRRP